MSAQKGKKKDLEKNFAEAICFICLEKGFDLNNLLNIEVSQFLVLLQYLEEQAEKQEKELKKSKMKRRR